MVNKFKNYKNKEKNQILAYIRAYKYVFETYFTLEYTSISFTWKWYDPARNFLACLLSNGYLGCIKFKPKLEQLVKFEWASSDMNKSHPLPKVGPYNSSQYIVMDLSFGLVKSILIGSSSSLTKLNKKASLSDFHIPLFSHSKH